MFRKLYPFSSFGVAFLVLSTCTSEEPRHGLRHRNFQCEDDACEVTEVSSVRLIQVGYYVADKLKKKQEGLSVMPIPSIVSGGGGQLSVSDQLTITGDIEDSNVAFAINRHKRLAFPHHGKHDGNITTLSIKFKTQEDNMKPTQMEAYGLEVDDDGIRIEAYRPVGVLYALETLSQLISFNFDSATYVTQPVLPLRIWDEPRYSHRGLLVDTSRHFLSVAALKQVLDSMAYVKLNRLHWHVTDAQSFPLNSPAEPSLAEKGAWSGRERFVREDVQDVVEYARQLGIVVVPEFDMPGHSQSWGFAEPAIVEALPRQYSNGDGNDGALDPTKPETYTLVRKLLTDFLSSNGTVDGQAMFDTPYAHLGFDEVPTKAWLTHGTDPSTLFQTFLERAVSIVGDLGKEVVLWEEALKSGKPPTSAIIQVWLDRTLAQRATRDGHKVIMSEGWYLDHLDEDWWKMYQKDPGNIIDADKQDMVLGGEGCMWGETVDEGNLLQTVWPRLGAIAERLWSPKTSFGGRTEVEDRLHSFRCLLLERGVPSGTVGGTGRQGPTGPGSCIRQ